MFLRSRREQPLARPTPARVRNDFVYHAWITVGLSRKRPGVSRVSARWERARTLIVCAAAVEGESGRRLLQSLSRFGWRRTLRGAPDFTSSAKPSLVLLTEETSADHVNHNFLLYGVGVATRHRHILRAGSRVGWFDAFCRTVHRGTLTLRTAHHPGTGTKNAQSVAPSLSAVCGSLQPRLVRSNPTLKSASTSHLFELRPPTMIRCSNSPLRFQGRQGATRR